MAFTIDEKDVAKKMKLFGCTREEAISVIMEDAEIDKMTSTKQIDSDLTEEQRKNAKAQKGTGERKTTAYKFDTSKRERKANEPKRHLIGCVKTLLEGLRCEVEVTNVERQIDFTYEGVKYRIVLSAPRS